MILDVINIVKVRKAVLCGLLLLAFVLLQDIVLARVVILGVRPFITPIAVAAAGFFNGGVWGAVCGIAAGIITDDALNGPAVMMTMVFPVIGFFSGALPLFLVSRRFSAFAMISVGAMLITVFCQMFRYLVFTDTALLPMLLTALMQLAWSVPFIFAVYFPFKAASGLDLSK